MPLRPPLALAVVAVRVAGILKSKSKLRSSLQGIASSHVVHQVLKSKAGAFLASIGLSLALSSYQLLLSLCVHILLHDILHFLIISQLSLYLVN